MESVLNKDVPCSYELSWQNHPPLAPKIIIRIHRRIAIRAGSVSAEDSVRNLKRRFDANVFCTRIAGPFGFDGLLSPHHGCEQFIELHAKLPTLNHNSSWITVQKLTATLEILFAHLNTQEISIPKEVSRKQLLTVSLCAGLKDHNRELSGEFSPKLLGWLSEYRRYDDFPAVKTAMESTYAQLRGSAREPSDSFTAKILHPGGYLAMSCPDSDNLAPDNKATCQQAVKNKVGCRVVASEMTSNLQQLTLLAGLAKLHDLARESIRETSTTI